MKVKKKAVEVYTGRTDQYDLLVSLYFKFRGNETVAKQMHDSCSR